MKRRLLVVVDGLVDGAEEECETLLRWLDVHVWRVDSERKCTERHVRKGRRQCRTASFKKIQGESCLIKTNTPSHPDTRAQRGMIVL